MSFASRIATTAVTPHCPRCGLPVRSSIQLRADAADLKARVLAARSRLKQQRTAKAWCGYQEQVAAAAYDLEVLEAELAGGHLTCPIL